MNIKWGISIWKHLLWDRTSRNIIWSDFCYCSMLLSAACCHRCRCWFVSLSLSSLLLMFDVVVDVVFFVAKVNDCYCCRRGCCQCCCGCCHCCCLMLSLLSSSLLLLSLSSSLFFIVAAVVWRDWSAFALYASRMHFFAIEMCTATFGFCSILSDQNKLQYF